MSENGKLHDALERQREVIAALRNEVATKDKQIAVLADKLQAGAYHDKDTALIMDRQAQRITELETSVQDYIAHYQHEATHNGLRMIEIGVLKKRIAELEAQLAAVLATVEQAVSDGKVYSEGCKP